MTYRNTYNKPPRERQTAILVEGLPLQKEQIKVAQLIAAKGSNLLKGMNKEFVVSQASEFAIRQNYKKQLLAAASEAHRTTGSNDVVRDLLNGMLRFQPYDATADSLRVTDVDAIFDLMADQRQEFSSSVTVLNNHRATPSRGCITLLLAPTNLGKSWWLIDYGWKAIQRGHRVLHVTLEISDQEVIQRYWQTIWRIPSHRNSSVINVL